MNAIEIKNVEKKYEGFTLGPLDLNIEKGMVTGLIGENGAGKTTLIKCIMELIRFQGEIEIFGKKLSNELKQDIGVVMGSPFFYGEFTSKDCGELLKTVYKNWDENYYLELLHRFKVPDKKLKELSTGNLSRLKIIMAMSHRPRLLILDEPTAGLDPVVRDEILELFYEFMEDGERTILFSTHIISDLEKIADSICYIQNGKLLLQANRDELLDDMGILKTSSEKLVHFDPSYFVRKRKHQFATDVLIRNRVTFMQRYAHEVVDVPSIEEIMLFYGRGEQ